LVLGSALGQLLVGMQALVVPAANEAVLGTSEVDGNTDSSCTNQCPPHFSTPWPAPVMKSVYEFYQLIWTSANLQQNREQLSKDNKYLSLTWEGLDISRDLLTFLLYHSRENTVQTAGFPHPPPELRIQYMGDGHTSILSSF